MRLLRRLSVQIEADFSYPHPQSQVLHKALSFVPEHGFTKQALLKASDELGYTPVTHGIFPRGPIELVEYFVETSTMNLRNTIDKTAFDKLGMTGRIRMLCLSRLEMTQPFVHQWPDAARMMLLPQNAPHTVEQLQRLVDEMWFLAGDTSLNWYSKRMLLAGVYTSTEMYMTTDSSPGFEETKKFLDRRLMDVGTVGKTIGNATSAAGYLAGTLSGLFKSVR
ncbi:COQ9-domain-containing protein [Gorgonomyces haynaldii]|nr:COQ9-domain-containing protein [Gorgonomyces haynaldii]KAI8906357.1 COQ9-domain-containing protein [Gorgonomyces haynaldii]